MSLPIPFIDFLPKIYRDNPKDSTTALTDKVDTHLTEWLNDIIQLAWLKDPFKINVLFLDVLGNFLNAGLISTDTEAQKRNKIATAIQGHKLRGSFELDAKPKIDAIAGGDSQIFRSFDKDDWILVGDGLTPTDFFWATIGVDNLMDRGKCESTTAPMISGETVPTLTNTTFARDNAQAHAGTYSYKATKTISAGTAAFVSLVDNNDTDDMHGMIPGSEYDFSMWIYIPSGGPVGSEVSIFIEDYVSGWQSTSVLAAATYDAWQELTVTRKLRSGATGATLSVGLAPTVSSAEFIYVDDIVLSNINSDYGLSLIGEGTEVEVAGNIYIDVDNSGLSTAEVQQIVDALEFDIVPAYYIVNIGYVDGTGAFIIYAGGVIS